VDAPGVKGRLNGANFHVGWADCIMDLNMRICKGRISKCMDRIGCC
jgi:hypothetical protein